MQECWWISNRSVVLRFWEAFKHLIHPDISRNMSFPRSSSDGLHEVGRMHIKQLVVRLLPKISRPSVLSQHVDCIKGSDFQSDHLERLPHQTPLTPTRI